MSKERMGTLPQEEIANAMASRTLNDAELIKGGAEYAVDSEGNSRLELTAEQLDNAHSEMEIDLEKRAYQKRQAVRRTKIEALNARPELHDLSVIEQRVSALRQEIEEAQKNYLINLHEIEDGPEKLEHIKRMQYLEKIKNDLEEYFQQGRFECCFDDDVLWSYSSYGSKGYRPGVKEVITGELYGYDESLPYADHDEQPKLMKAELKELLDIWQRLHVIPREPGDFHSEYDEFQRFVENLAIYIELPPAEVQYALSKQFNPAREIKYRHLLHEKIRNHYQDIA
jgi:hypothetical protein